MSDSRMRSVTTLVACACAISTTHALAGSGGVGRIEMIVQAESIVMAEIEEVVINSDPNIYGFLNEPILTRHRPDQGAAAGEDARYVSDPDAGQGGRPTGTARRRLPAQREEGSRNRRLSGVLGLRLRLRRGHPQARPALGRPAGLRGVR